MPLFGTGHARFKFDQALIAIRDTLRSTTAAGIEQAIIVVFDPDRAAEARKLLVAGSQ